MNTIEFPKLGLVFNVNPDIISIGPFTIHWYGLLIATGFVIAVILGLRYAKTQGVQPDTIIDLLLVTVPAAIIGARLYYVVFSISDYIDNPLGIFKIWEGGLAIYGGVIAALVTVYFLSKKKKLNSLLLFDIAMPYIALAQAVGRWGNFANQEAFGTNTTLPWGMTGNIIKSQLIFMAKDNPNLDPLIPVHPTFLYESLWCIIIFIIMAYYRKNIKVAHGEILGMYMVTYGIGRAVIESLRTDSLMLFGFRVSQILSILLVLAGITLILFLRNKQKAAIGSGLGDSEEEPVINPKYRQLLEEREEGKAKAREDSEQAEEPGTPEKPSKVEKP